MAGFFFAILTLWMFIPAFSHLLNFHHGIVRGGKVVFTLSMSDQLTGKRELPSLSAYDALHGSDECLLPTVVVLVFHMPPVYGPEREA